MAIIESLPGVEVTIVADGKPLKEYVDGDVEGELKSMRCYIEAVTGKLFEIRMKVAKGTKITRNRIDFKIAIDGQWVGTPRSRRSKIAREDTERISEGRNVGGGKLQKYRFSELETGDRTNIHLIVMCF